jgi:hypothetical protein
MSPGNFRLDWPCQIRCVSLHLKRPDHFIYTSIRNTYQGSIRPPPRCLNRKRRPINSTPESRRIYCEESAMTSGGITSPARRAHRIMNRDVPDEKEPRKARKIFVTAFYARSGPSWISFGKFVGRPDQNAVLWRCGPNGFGWLDVGLLRAKNSVIRKRLPRTVCNLRHPLTR